MDNYIVSARKYRPSTFSSVVGQSALTTTLKNAVSTGKLAHAYLFCGPRGVGKTTCARIFAKTINCLAPTPDGEACNECESCRAFNENRSYNVSELDAASNNSVEDIRSLIDQVQVPPQIGRYKVFIIDEVHMLSQAAFNAFLKTLEEPPAHAVFILATTEKQKILPTILSRCQTYDFQRMTVADTVRHLEYVAREEGVTCEPEALHVIAEKADGGMRDALSIFDQVASYCEGNVTYQKVIEDLNVLDSDEYFAMTDLLLKTDIPQAMLRLNGVLSRGFGGNYFTVGLAAHFRNLLLARDEGTLPLLDVSDSVRARYAEQAKRCQPKWLYRSLKLCSDCDLNYRASNNKRLLVELTLIEVAQAAAGDDEVCGRGPIRRLHPIFRHTAPAPVAPKAAPQRPATAAASLPSQQTPAAPSAAAPAAAPHAVPQAAATTRVAAPVLSLHKLRQEYEEGQKAPAQQNTTMLVQGTDQGDVQGECEPFSMDDLIYCWFSYAQLLPQEHKATAARMKLMKPTVDANWQVDVPVENEMVADYMRAILPGLLGYLRSHLHNNRIGVNIRVHQSAPGTQLYRRSDQFADMLKRSTALTMLKDALGLELA